jgi:hypothetical protein
VPVTEEALHRRAQETGKARDHRKRAPRLEGDPVRHDAPVAVGGDGPLVLPLRMLATVERWRK